MKEQTFYLEDDGDLGLRLDSFLAKKIPQFSRAKIQSLISSGFVFLNNKKILKNSFKISNLSDEIKVLETSDQSSNEGEDFLLSKLVKKYNFSEMIHEFEDENLFLINKPAGLLSQNKPSAENKANFEISVSELAKNYINKSAFSTDDWEKGREFIVHRLDKETSGLMIIPKTIESYNFLKNEFSERRVKKKYKGIVWGAPNPAVHRLENEVKRDRINRMKMMIVTNPKILDEISWDEKKQTKTAITNYRVEKILFGGAMSLVEFEIETGRTHQIRLQMSFFGHPIVFDSIYGGSLNQKAHVISKTNNEKNSEKIIQFLRQKSKNPPRHLLHSHSISFFHPKTFEFLNFDTGENFSDEINDLLAFNNDLYLN